MPAVGRKPKPEDQRRNRSQPAHEWLDVLDAPYDGPVPSIGRVAARTKQWWAVVSSMPHCVLWDPSDWQFAVDTALVHAEWAKTKKSSLAVELRQREKLLGLTWDARRDLRIRYVTGIIEDEAPKPVSIEDRRRELAE
jgi:hypothetical protein